MPNVLDGKLLKQMIISAANNLSNNKKIVDDLNVFPVPDGDTGTNMSLTILAVKRELESMDEGNCSEVMAAAATASLRGARGNSGVILSQFFRGLSRGIDKKETLTVDDLCKAMALSKETAYRAVMKPTEGTILTVAREMSEFADEYQPKDGDILEFMQCVVKEGNKSLDNTPNLLPQLKQANVVDSGGKGLMVALEGALYFLENGEIVASADEVEYESKIEKTIDVENIKFGYCTEFIIKKTTKKADWKKLRKQLEYIGDSVIVIDDADIIKVHVHTNNPGIALEEALKLGQLVDIKIDNLKEQAEEEKAKKEQEAKEEIPFVPNAFITVAAGDGLVQMFSELGCTGIIEGGQTMNPSTDDFMKEIDKINADNIFILPNNKNIILAAEQAAELSDKNIIVIKTKTVMQGMACMMAFDEESNAEENTDAMNQAITNVASGSVTFAARDCKIDELEIKKDDIMGLAEGKITFIGQEPHKVCEEIVSQLIDSSKSSISIFKGEDADDDKTDEMLEELEEKYPDFDVNVYEGKQPLYYYLISVE